MLAVLLYVLFVVVGVRFFEPGQVGALLVLAGGLWLAAALWRHRSLKEAIVPSTATIVGITVWILESTMVLQLLPVMVSRSEFVKFVDAAVNDRPFLSKMVKAVPKVPLDDAKLAYIDRSHGYWAVVTGINTAIQIAMAVAPLPLWALYTTAGWYLLFAAALAAQIVYGRVHGV